MSEFLTARTKQEKKIQANSLVAQLNKAPKRARGVNQAHFPRSGKLNAEHQADLLFLPDDKGYKYLLVIVDNGTRKVDAEPLRTKQPTEVLGAFKRIYSRSILSKPILKLRVDKGSEFLGTVKKWFETFTRFEQADTGDSRAMSLVESANKQIGRALFRAMRQKELEQGSESFAWRQYVQPIVNALSSRASSDTEKQLKKESKKQGSKIFADPLCSGSACKVLKVGSKVRIPAIKARELGGNVVSGDSKNFRATDNRWSLKVYTIDSVIVKGNTPPLYQVSINGVRIKNKAFTKNNLQLVDKNSQNSQDSKNLKKLEKPVRVRKPATRKVPKKILQNVVKILNVSVSGRRKTYQVLLGSGLRGTKTRGWLISNGYKDMVENFDK